MCTLPRSSLPPTRRHRFSTHRHPSAAMPGSTTSHPRAFAPLRRPQVPRGRVRSAAVHAASLAHAAHAARAAAHAASLAHPASAKCAARATAALAARLPRVPRGASPPLHISYTSPSPAPSGATHIPSTQGTLSHAPPAAATIRSGSAPPAATLSAPLRAPPPRRGLPARAAPKNARRGGPPPGLPRSCTTSRPAASEAVWPRGRLRTTPRLDYTCPPRSCTPPAPRCILVSRSQAASARAGAPQRGRRRPSTTPDPSLLARAARSARLT